MASSSIRTRARAGYFLTKIYHPNISKGGEICVNTLKKDWQSSLGIGHVLQVVRCLLINPFPESALNEEAGKDFMEDYEEYGKKARMYTEVHARPKKVEASSGDDGTEVSQQQQPPRAGVLAAPRLKPHAHHGLGPLSPPHLTSFERAALAQGEPLEKKQKPVDTKAAEKRKAEKKKSLKRL